MKFDTDKLLGISAIVVGLCSLFIVVYQTMLARETARAEVMPYLMVAMLANSNDGVFLLVNNTGIGPALIEEVRVRKGDELFAGDAFDFLNAQQDLPLEIGILDVDSIRPGRLIPAGATLRTVGTNGQARELVYREFLHRFSIDEVPDTWYRALEMDPAANRAVLEIDYASVYGERWRVRSDSLVPQAL